MTAKKLARIIMFVLLPIWILPVVLIGLGIEAWRAFNEMLDSEDGV